MPLMARLLQLAGAAVVAIGLGLGSAYLAVRSGLAGGEGANGPWRTSLVTGSPDADLYTRVRVAVGGLLALAPSETIYFTAATDSDDQPLEARCDYIVRGEELPARWWSVTAYGADHFLIPNDAHQYSFSQTTLTRAPGGPWTVAVSTERRDGDWLPSGRPGSAGPFTLTIRLYNPAHEVHARPGTVSLPRIEKEKCR
jgi:hypothetical protein